MTVVGLLTPGTQASMLAATDFAADRLAVPAHR
jgi:hypothetical protein